MNQLRFRPVKHLKLSVWTSVLWKNKIHIAKKWPEMVLQQLLKSNIHFRSLFRSKSFSNLFINIISPDHRLLHSRLHIGVCLKKRRIGWFCFDAFPFLHSYVDGVQASTFGPITSSSHVFTNSESTKPDVFPHEICCLLWSVLNEFSIKSQNR